MCVPLLPSVVRLVLEFFKNNLIVSLGEVITYVKQLSDVQSTENSTDLPHVPLSSSSSCLKPLLSSSRFGVKDSD